MGTYSEYLDSLIFYFYFFSKEKNPVQPHPEETFRDWILQIYWLNWKTKDLRVSQWGTESEIGQL